jgi:hypothetical protein
LPMARGAVEMRPTFDFDVSLEGSDIIISHGRDFPAVYYQPAGSAQLILRQRTKCDDDELLAAVLIAANDKARKLEWIVTKTTITLTKHRR